MPLSIQDSFKDSPNFRERVAIEHISVDSFEHEIKTLSKLTKSALEAGQDYTTKMALLSDALVRISQKRLFEQSCK